jgi:hypothetical protein
MTEALVSPDQQDGLINVLYHENHGLFSSSVVQVLFLKLTHMGFCPLVLQLELGGNMERKTPIIERKKRSHEPPAHGLRNEIAIMFH